MVCVVFALIDLGKKVDSVFLSQYDIRVLTNVASTCLGINKLPLKFTTRSDYVENIIVSYYEI
ncbi:hypothetical protein [Clostridium sp. JS66]|uniref:hypothetical protein n=1 Tax=Clostridium sp. JS66 TaxID=3064705 RepID=UPI00298EB417|nr:hypothetical protein [Clostridium sp. JS66]WPC40180.1 hypothetical protein Q6H37_20050 [Clostridium sp. JS66]